MTDFRYFLIFCLFVCNGSFFLFSIIFKFACFYMFYFFCVKPPAPEAQRLDDAIGFLRDHAEVNVSSNNFDCFFILLNADL